MNDKEIKRLFGEYKFVDHQENEVYIIYPEELDFLLSKLLAPQG